MKKADQRKALAAAVKAARTAGKLMRQNLRASKVVNAKTSHDIKLELDVRCQDLIGRMLHHAFPGIPLLGEEGDSGATDTAAARWVVDPIDGTVNFAYGIPHACVSIALQIKPPKPKVQSPKPKGITPYDTVVGVVFDPFTKELWTAIRGESAYLNGHKIRVSRRKNLKDAIVSIGFAKNKYNLERALPYFNWLARRVRKIRMFGAAALGLTWVATGRLDAYIERGINLWDVAAGGLIIQCAGGEFWLRPVPGAKKFRMVASNKFLHDKLPMPR